MANPVRIDKFLWAVRLYKTRSLAAEACSKGKISINGIQAKPSRDVKPGDVLHVVKNPVTYHYKVTDVSEKRMGAKLVADFIQDITPKENLEVLEMQKYMQWSTRERGAGSDQQKEKDAKLTAFLMINFFKKQENMIVAREKRKNNIAEYIIYMWQVEDLIRALKLDMDAIKVSLVAQYQVNEDTRAEVSDWYANLVLMMEKEQKHNGGHVQFLVNLVNDLNRFHLALLNTNTDVQYSRLFNEIKPDLELVKQKAGLVHNDIETALNTLYLLIMLKMKEKNVSEGTQQAVWKFGNFLGYLSKLYKMWEAGDLELEY